MAIKVPNGGELKLLDAIVAGVGTFYYRLFSNDYTPVDGSTAGNFTEATYDGYAALNPSWGSAATNGSNEAEVTASDLVFECTGNSTPNTIYGYYVTDSGGDLLYAERFGSSTPMNDNGDTVTIPPVFTLRSIS